MEAPDVALIREVQEELVALLERALCGMLQTHVSTALTATAVADQLDPHLARAALGPWNASMSESRRVPGSLWRCRRDIGSELRIAFAALEVDDLLDVAATARRQLACMPQGEMSRMRGFTTTRRAAPPEIGDLLTQNQRAALGAEALDAIIELTVLDSAIASGYEAHDDEDDLQCIVDALATHMPEIADPFIWSVAA